MAEFAGQVSHDLKNPLSAITMSLELAQDEADDLGLGSDHALPSFLARAARSAQRLRTMLDDLHDYALAGSSLTREAVDLAAVVSELVAEVDPAVSVAELPTVTGDRAQLRQLLGNLIDNAVTFTRDGQPPAVAVRAERVGGGWRVLVTDRGCGVPAADRARVFEPMVRLDKSIPGTGLGLSACRRIVAAHDGQIGLDAGPDGGTIAWFELPD